MSGSIHWRLTDSLVYSFTDKGGKRRKVTAMTSFNRKWKSAALHTTNCFKPPSNSCGICDGTEWHSSIGARRCDSRGHQHRSLVAQQQFSSSPRAKSYTITAETKGAAPFTEQFPTWRSEWENGEIPSSSFFSLCRGSMLVCSHLHSK